MATLYHTYVVDSTGDKVTEYAGEGWDWVRSWVSYSLPADVGCLELHGGWADEGYGNALANVIKGLVSTIAYTLFGYAGNDGLRGNGANDFLYGGDGNDSLWGWEGNDYLVGDDGNDRLFGGPGNDTMTGGAGNDTYVVGSAGDVIVEVAGKSVDTVQAFTSYTLPAQVENLIVYETALNGTGNALNNAIFGNSLDNTLAGLGGNDSLDGGSGADSCVFSETGAANCDTIIGFSHASDTIVLTDLLDGVTDATIQGLSFSPTKVLLASCYFAGAGTGNGLNDPSGIYNDTSTGTIWYNPTSHTASDSVEICTVGVTTAPKLDHTDFVASA